MTIMTDVYAGDDHLLSPSEAGIVLPCFFYVIIADADPDVLLRVASHLMLANRAPSRLVLRTLSAGSIVIEAEMREISVHTAESIRRKLLQLSCAQSVTMSQASP